MQIVRNLDNNNHSVFSMHYHMILVVKYRRRVIDDKISEYLKKRFDEIGNKYHISIEEWNHEPDHIHVLFKAEPKTELTKFINSYKSASSRLVKKEYPEIEDSLWKQCFWSKSFCLLTVGNADWDTIHNYIQTQGEAK